MVRSGAAGEPAEHADRAGLGGPPQREFDHHLRQAQGEAEQQEHQQEGAATVGGSHIGELPDGAETDRRTCGGQDITEPG